jgi:hypothetical protein
MPSIATREGKANRTSAGTTALLAAPGAGKYYKIRSITVTIHTIAATGKAIIDDGTTEFFGWDAITAASGQPPQLSWPSDACPTWTVNKAVNITTEGAIEVFAHVIAELKS